MIIFLHNLLREKIRVLKDFLDLEFRLWHAVAVVYVWKVILPRGFSWNDLYFFIPLFVFVNEYLLHLYKLIINTIRIYLNKKFFHRMFILSHSGLITFTNIQIGIFGEFKNTVGVIIGGTAYVDDWSKDELGRYLKKFYSIVSYENLSGLLESNASKSIDDIKKELVVLRLEGAKQ